MWDLGPKWANFESQGRFKNCFVSNNVVHQLLILGLFWTFWGPNRLFSGWKGLKTVLGSTHVVKQLLFSIVASILTFDFDLILGSFLTFWDLNGLVHVWFKDCFGVYSCS